MTDIFVFSSFYHFFTRKLIAKIALKICDSIENP